MKRNLYEGEFLSDRPHGRGTYTWSDGSRFNGLWSGGSGSGIFHAANGDRYEGDLADNKFHGRGKYFMTTGEKYEGDWEDGLKHGRGKWYFENG
jgi:hypothetical protein